MIEEYLSKWGKQFHSDESKSSIKLIVNICERAILQT